MFRLLYEYAVRLLTGPRANSHPLPDDWNRAHEPPAADPYVWRLPNPHDARWRRWARRSRAVGHRLPFPCDEEGWHSPTRPGTPLWEAADKVVRPYVVDAGPLL